MFKDVIFRDIDVEAIAESVHHIYCQYYIEVLGTEYWTKGDYGLLDEKTKEADRYIARFIMSRELTQAGGEIADDGHLAY